MYVCMYVYLSEQAVRAIRSITKVKRQICGNIKKAFFLKLSYSKTSAGAAIFS